MEIEYLPDSVKAFINNWLLYAPMISPTKRTRFFIEFAKPPLEFEKSKSFFCARKYHLFETTYQIVSMAPILGVTVSSNGQKYWLRGLLHCDIK